MLLKNIIHTHQTCCLDRYNSISAVRVWQWCFLWQGQQQFTEEVTNHSFLSPRQHCSWLTDVSLRTTKHQNTKQTSCGVWFVSPCVFQVYSKEQPRTAYKNECFFKKDTFQHIYWHIYFVFLQHAFEKLKHHERKQQILRQNYSRLNLSKYYSFVMTSTRPFCSLIGRPALNARFLYSYWSMWSSIIAEVPPWKSMKSERDLQSESRVKLERGRQHFPGNQETCSSK